MDFHLAAGQEAGRNSRSRISTAAAIAVAVFVCGRSEVARAADQVEQDIREHGVVQERKHDPKHEFRLSLGYLPQDPFYKAAGPDFAYLWHGGEYFTWEVVRIGAYGSFDSELRNKLRSEFDAVDDPYEKPIYMVTSHAQWTPFYGRYTVMNRGILHQEIYFTGGGGMIGWAKPEDGQSGGGPRPTFDGGFGFRWYAGTHWSVRLELLEQAFMRSDGSIGDQFYVTLGGSFLVQRKKRIGSAAP